MKKLKILFAAVLALISSNEVYSQEFETDRPSQVAASSTIPKGSLQTETGIGTEIIWNPGNQIDYSYLLPTSLFRIALANKFEIRVQNTLRSRRLRTDSTILIQNLSIDDVQAGFKWQIAKGDGWKPQLALISHAIIPSTVTSKDRIFGAINTLAVSHDFTEKFGLGYNVGHFYPGKGNGDLTFAIAPTFGVLKTFTAYIQYFGQLTELDSDNLESNAGAGFTFRLKENVQIDYSFAWGVNRRENFQQIGVSLRFSN